MNEKIIEYYFPIIKFICIFSLIIYFIIINSSFIYINYILQVGMLLLFASIMIIYELLSKKSLILLAFGAVICITLTLSYQNFYSLLIPIVILDAIVYFKLPKFLSLITFLIILLNCGDKMVYLITCTACNIIYFQHYCIVKKYKELLNSFINSEADLKSSIENQKLMHKLKIKKYSLAYEKKMLEEKSRLSQQLHDKIGHSINGSVYQLEASKLLMDSNAAKSREIVQAVIDNLRESLDEIRAILRKEKPGKGEISLLKLKKLCEEFNESYNINAKLNYTGEEGQIPENMWKIILDNSVEAFSNALKYSRCRIITINIAVLNKLVRCTIKDDGKGCSNFKEGMGISGMKERTEAAGGNIYISSELGFEINMLLPIR